MYIFPLFACNPAKMAHCSENSIRFNTLKTV